MGLPSRNRVVPLALAALVACVAIAAASGALPRSATVRLDQVLRGSLGVVRPGDFWNAATGPSLLADPAMTARLRARLTTLDMVRESDLLCLLYCGRRLQGQSATDIAADEGALPEVLGTLVAEGSPPAWWSEASWLRERLSAAPRDGFQLGLLPEAVARELVGRRVALPGPRTREEARALVRAATLHARLLSREQADALLLAWRQRLGEFGWAVDPALEARGRLAVLAAPLAVSGRVAVEIDAAAVPAAARPHAVAAVQGLLKSAGFEPAAGAEGVLTIRLSVATRDFPGVRWSHGVSREARVPAPGRTTPGRTVPVISDYGQEVVTGRLRASTLVLEAQGGALRVEGAPFGVPQPEAAAQGGPLLDATSPAERRRLHLPDEEELLLGGWRWGL